MNALETRVLELIGEDPENPDVFIDTEEDMAPIRDSISDAVQEICMLVGAKRERYFIPLRDRQMFYRLSLADSYFGWVTDAWSHGRQCRLEQTDLVRLSATDPRWMVTNAEPRAYFHIGQDVIGFWPKPSASQNLIEIQIVEIPKTYDSESDRINLRKEFEHAAINYAVAEYWASRGDARQAETFFGFYLETLGIRETLNPNRDSAPALRVTKDPWPLESAS